MVTANTNAYVGAYPEVVSLLCGQTLPWLQQLRADALLQLTAHGFPSFRDEEWRYTNVSAIDKKHYGVALNTASAAIDIDWLKTYQLADAWSLVLVDGYFSAELSNLNGLPEGVTVVSLAQALQDTHYSALIEGRLNSAVESTENGFVAFNGAYFVDGVLIHVPSKQIVAKPIQILHIATQALAAINTRTVIVADELSEAQLIETFAGLDCAYLSVAVAEVFVGQNADVTLHKVQVESDNALHFGGIYVKQARDARFRHNNFALGGLLARSDVHTDLDQSSECELNGLYLGVKRQHIDNHTRINHLKPHGTSRQLYKGVLDDRARGVFQGRVVVSEDAQKTDSQMNNRNLLLSSDAEADTKPQLEIYADDVKCAHGVTVGQLDEKSIFYLQSRCVDEETARNMLTFAFANEMVDKVKIKSLHDLILGQVLTRFPQEGINKEWL
jgi:Fe-S cluster assembly protein SufD